MMTVLTFIVAIAVTLFSYRRQLRYLRFLQQEQYSSARFRTWLREKRAFDRKGTVLLILLLGVASVLAGWGGFLISVFLATALAITPTAFEEDPRTLGKIKLVMTDRAKRIFHLALALTISLELATLFIIPGLSMFIVAQIILVQLLPFVLIAANELLQPGENRFQARLLNEAKERLAEAQPLVVGITGSYGKTSTKNCLAELLATCVGPTFWPPLGVNTPMGITREMRERLRPGYQFAVIEMGAYAEGSIKRLCDLTPPKAAIITAVGVMHLERYDSPDDIYRAKSELAQAVPQSGILVCNGDNAGARKMATEFKKATTLIYGLDATLGHLDCRADNLKTTANGTEFTIHYGGRSYPSFTKLLGSAAIGNILGAFTMAVALGGDPEFLVAAIRNLKPVSNRLSLDKAGDIIYLRDAYNSNPEGFASALDVLRDMPAKRRVLMTPGMVELGPQQNEKNQTLAEKSAGICDLVLVVGETNRVSLLAGLKKGGLAEDRCRIFDTRDAALGYWTEIQSSGDVILLENDLPDLYEASNSF